MGEVGSVVETLAAADMMCNKIKKREFLNRSSLFFFGGETMHRRNKLKYDNKQHYIHRLIAKKALGEHLPEGCVVHHHTDTQLVICENHKYHMLLHQRMRALRACGHASWRKCNFCGEYDKPTKPVA